MAALMGRMMHMPLMISSLMVHAARHFGDTEIVSRRAEGDVHRTDWARTELRARKLAQALNRLQSRVAAHVAERTQILAAISHDLQTPITRLRLRVEAWEASAAQDKLLADIDQISQLARDGLNYARSATVATGPALRLDLRSFLESLVADYQDAGKAVQLADGPSALHSTHPEVLRRVLQNLIDNSAKFMGEQKQPRVEVGARRDGPDDLVFYVRDNGKGIDPRFLDRVFGLFDKLDPESEGSGVGLALVKRIVDLHKGRVWVESEGAGRGTTVCFTLPEPEALTAT